MIGSRGRSGGNAAVVPQPVDEPARSGYVPLHELVGRPTADGATIAVTPDSEADVRCAYGWSPGVYTQTTEVVRVWSQCGAMLELTELPADQVVYYRLWSAPAGGTLVPATHERSFRTARSSDSAFAFAVIADDHMINMLPDNPPGVALYHRTLQQIAARNPDFLLHLGDFATIQWAVNQPELDAQSLAQARERYRLQRLALDELQGCVPFYLALGNHEAESGWRYDGTPNCLAAWGQAARNEYIPNPTPGAFYDGWDEYVPDIGLRRAVFGWPWGGLYLSVFDPYWRTMNDPCISGDDWDWSLAWGQYAAVHDALNGRGQVCTWRVLAGHQLLASYNAGGNPHYGRGGAEIAGLTEWGDAAGWAQWRGWPYGPLTQICADTGVDLMLHGHDHLFAYQEAGGLRYLECPTPSDVGYRCEYQVQGGYQSGVILPNSGYLWVQVDATSLTIDYQRVYLPGQGTEGCAWQRAWSKP